MVDLMDSQNMIPHRWKANNAHYFGAHQGLGYTRRPIRVPMLTHVARVVTGPCFTWTWYMFTFTKGSDDTKVPGGEWQPGEERVMLRAMFFWETQSPCIHVDISLTYHIYLTPI